MHARATRARERDARRRSTRARAPTRPTPAPSRAFAIRALANPRARRDVARGRIRDATTASVDARRARLAAMRASAGADDADARVGARAPREAPAREVTFRNYVPRDGALAAAKLPATTAPALDVARAREGDDGAAALALEPNVGDVDPGMVAPRRANWDLKRDVEARLEKLERRTRRALVDVARDEALKRAASGE